MEYGFVFPYFRIYLKKWTIIHATTFMYENIISRFGCLKILVSDRGTHFLNSLIKEMNGRFQIDHKQTILYHPQTNGQMERVKGTLVSILRKIVIDSKRGWDVKLIAALWVYRTIFKVITHAIPFSLVFGIEATLPIEFKVESLQWMCTSTIVSP